jgi:DNA-binding transcriptional LysR family regulator
MQKLPLAQDLTFLLEVAQARNLSRAAERLGISQPGLSMAIKRLEETVGQELLVRSKTGVELTRSGEKLVSSARELLGDWGKLVEDLARDQQELRGRFTIGLHRSVALYCADKFTTQMLLAHPELELRFVHDLSRKITEDVVSFKTDIGLVINPVPHPDLIIKEISKDEVGFWRSKKDNALNTPGSGQAVLILEPDMLQSQELLQKLGKKRGLFDRTITTSDLELIRTLTLNGAGVGILPQRVIGELQSKFEMVAAMPRYQDYLGLVYRADLHRAAGFRLFAQEIANILQSSLG